jgi:imidazole glycerol-phosphate synthase subunit HisF
VAVLKKRLIAVIIVRQGQVVQSVQFRHTNVIHYDAAHAVEAFNSWDVDEMVLLNVSRKAETRDAFLRVVENASRHCFVPLSVGGWITDADYAARLLRSGGDKLVLNTAIATNKDLVSLLSRRYGAQCIVASIDVKRSLNDEPTVHVDRGRTDTRREPADWACEAAALGAGEILFNSVDHDGARRGYDLSSLRRVCQAVQIPVIAFGGAFEWRHLEEGIAAGADAVAAANIFHYTEHSTKKAKAYLLQRGVPIRLSGVFESAGANRD